MAALTNSALTASKRGLGIASSVVVGQFVFGTLTFLLWLIVTLWEDFGHPWGAGTSAALALVLFSAHLAFAYRRVSAFDPAVWIPVAMLLFYFGVPIGIEFLRANTIYGYDVYRIGFIPQNLDKGICAALLGMCGFIFGLYLSGLRDMSDTAEPSGRKDGSLVVPGYLFTLFAMGMVAAGVVLVGPGVVFGYYSDWWAAKTAGADSRWIDIGIIFMQAGVYALLAADDRRHLVRRYFAYTVGLLIIAMAIQKGARAQLIAFSIGAGWCYSQRIRRVRPSVVVACAFMALLVLPVLREWRHSRSLAYSGQASLHELATASFIEMGGSVYTLAYTMDFLPQRGYAWGVTYRDSLIRSVPNFGLTPGKDWGESEIEDHPSHWISNILSPAWAAQGGGYGSSMMTELYFNFGVPGIALGASLLGFVTGRIRSSSRKSALWLVASALVFAGMTVHVRNVIGAPLKMMTWPVIGLAVFRFIVAPLMSKAGGRAAMLVDLPPVSLASSSDFDVPAVGAQSSRPSAAGDVSTPDDQSR